MKKQGLRPTLVLSLVLLGSLLHAQELPVTFRIVDQKKEPVPFASIIITNRLDSTTRYSKVADSLGNARFILQQNGQYLFRITAANFDPLEKRIRLGEQTQFHFTLTQTTKTLEEALVVSKKPLMRQEDDKTIIEPEVLVATSTSGYEVIEKTPGLFVDQDGNIYITSTTPATVQINGRELRMSSSDVATMLKSLPPTAISRIEIVRTPSAKYDASSSGGIVNVVLKKGVKIGMTGSVNAGFQKGDYTNSFAGFNLANNDGRKSFFINLNINRRNSYEQIRSDRFFSDSVLSQYATTLYPSTSYFAGYGYEFPSSKKWSYNFNGNISLNVYDNHTTDHSLLKSLTTNQGFTTVSQIGNDGQTLNTRNSFEVKQTMDTLGSEWTSDISHNYTGNWSSQDYSTDFPDAPITYFKSGDGRIENYRHSLRFQTDLRLKMKYRVTLEAGAKASWLMYDSKTDYSKTENGQHGNDPSRTNTFNYTENINALYLQGSKTLGKEAVIKAGLRMENTNMQGHQVIPYDTTFNIHRTDLFPYIYLSKNVITIFGYGLRAYLIYRRTISRPGYEQLNPFPRYVNNFLTEMGNPELKPQFTRNYEANISFDERPILAVGVNETENIFTNVIYQSDTSQVQTVRTYDNLGKNKEWYFRALGALPPGLRYFLVLGAQYNHNFYQGLYENKPLAYKKGTWTFFTYQTFRIDKRSMFTINGFIRLKGQQQFYELSTFGSLNASVNRQFLKQKLILTLSINDMFETNWNNFTMQQGSVTASGFRKGDTRRFGLNLRYNFGIKKKEENNTDYNPDASN